MLTKYTYKRTYARNQNSKLFYAISFDFKLTRECEGTGRMLVEPGVAEFRKQRQTAANTTSYPHP